MEGFFLLLISGQAIGGRKTVTITADTLYLNSTLIAPGADITVVARFVIGGDQAKIDVSGADGNSASPTPKPKQIAVNAPAPDGAAGTAGANAGTIRFIAREVSGLVTLSAKGGRGGSGQPGGDGADGAHGYPSGEDRKAGGNAGPTGYPGKGGDSGDSGNGGAIELFVTIGREGVSADVSGGPEIAIVANGNPGAQGVGGAGGREERCVRVDDPPRVGLSIMRARWDCYFTGDLLGRGSDGAVRTISTSGKKGERGDDGSIVDGQSILVAAPYSNRGLRLLAIEAETLHIRQEYAAAAVLAAWILVLCSESERSELADIRLRAVTLLGRISTGAPPEGIQGWYAPLTPLDVLLEQFEKLLESRYRAAGYADALKEDYHNETAIRKTISATRAVTGQVIMEASTRLAELGKRRERIVETIDTISSTYQDVWLEVQQANQAFRDEVSRANPCGNYLRAVIMVATVAVTVISAGSATAGAIAAGAEVLKYVKDDEKAKAEFDKTIAEAGGLKSRLEGYAKGAKDLIDAAEKLQEFLGGDEMHPPSDSVRVGMTRDDFNKMVQPYRGMAAAEHLSGLMDKFFSMTETRNNLLLEHDQLVIEAASARAQAAAAKRQQDDMVRSEGSALLANTIDVYESALWADLEAGKQLITALVRANMAYEYKNLTTRQIDLTSIRGDHLEHQYSALRGDSARPTEQARNTECMITIDRSSHPEVFKALETGADAIVSLMPGHVNDPQLRRWDERAHSVGIQIAGISSKKAPLELTATMINCGVSWFKKRDGSLMAMRVPTRDVMTTASSNLNLEELQYSRNFLDVNQSTVTVSPYGLWNLNIQGIGHHLRSIKSLTFYFIGSSRIAHDVAALLGVEREKLTTLLARPLAPMLLTDDTMAAANPVPDDKESEPNDPLLIQPGSALEEAAAIRLAEEMTYMRKVMIPAPIFK